MKLKTIALFWIASAAFAAAAQVQATGGLDILNALAKDPDNRIIPIHSCQLYGFIDDREPYRAPSVRRSAEGGRIVAIVPSAGVYYPGFVIYDTAGVERVGIHIDGVERGVAVADADDKRQRLFYLAEPYTFRGGEKIELCALTNTGIYRTEDLYLLKRKPTPRRHEYHITNVATRLVDDGPQPAALVTWITNWPAACSVEYGPQGAAQIKIAKEEDAFQNHRLMLSGLRPRTHYRFRVSAATREGAPVAGEWTTFSTQPPAPVAGSVSKSSVPVTTVNPLNPDSTSSGGAVPVTAGVPFAKGAIGSAEHLRLLDPTGKETPLQAQVLARWEDSSIKWALLDFQTDAPPKRAFTLEYGTQVLRRRQSTALKVTESPQRISVTTGPLRFTMSRARPGFVESLAVDSNRNGVFEEAEQMISPSKPAGFELIAADGASYTTLAPPDELVVEENGPLRTAIRASGEHRAAAGRKFFSYAIRLHAYAGQPFLRVQYTFGNNFSEPEFASFRSLILRVPFATPGKRWALGGDLRGDFANSPAPLLKQHSGEGFTVSTGARGVHAPGFAEWSDGHRQVTVALRDFWQNYPKDLRISASGIELGLCPALGEDEYAAFRGTTDEYKLYYYLLGGQYKLRQGVSKTHDIWLEFGADNGSPAAVRGLHSPWRATAPASWYVATKALGELAGPAASGLVADYDKAFSAGFHEYMHDRETERAYGMLNFGDWWGERVINWGNGEYDTQKALLLQWVRTGDASYFRPAEEMEWHTRDVDTIQHHKDPSRIGGVYHHAIGHTGGYYAKTPVPGQGIAPGILTVDHVYTEGHLAYHFLTGDRRSRETAEKIATKYGAWDTRNYDFFDSRVAGWHLILTSAVYEATRDPFYINAGRIIVDRVLERQTSNGGWDRWPICSHEEPLHAGELSYMLGVLLTGMTRYHEAARDPRVPGSILRGAHYLANEAWVPELQGFRYAVCPREVPTRGLDPLNFLIMTGLVAAHRETGDPKLRRIIVESTERAIQSLLRMGEQPGDRALGKMLGMYTGFTPHVIGYVAALAKPRQ